MVDGEQESAREGPMMHEEIFNVGDISCTGKEA